MSTPLTPERIAEWRACIARTAWVEVDGEHHHHTFGYASREMLLALLDAAEENVRQGERIELLTLDLEAVSRNYEEKCREVVQARQRADDLAKQVATLTEALRNLADKVDATSECDHKRASCEEIGCIGVQVKSARAALATVPPAEPVCKE